MAAIRSTNTTPEMKVRRYLFSRGLRYRLNVKNLPGKPDLVFPKYKTVVFVNGCFWHKHDCGKFHWPQSNEEYWRKKIFRNVERDRQNRLDLEAMGWKVITVWECELSRKNEKMTLEKLYNDIAGQNTQVCQAE